MPDPEPTNPSPEPTPIEPVEPVEPKPTLLSEPAPTPPAEPAPAPEPTVLTSQVSPVKPDGTFIEGWRDMLPDDVKQLVQDNKEIVDLIGNFPEMVKQTINQRKAIGKDKVVLPTEKSTPEEWNSFYERLGRPKTETGYHTPEVPEALSEIFTEDRLNRVKTKAHALGATQKQFEEFLKADIEEVQTLLNEQDKVELQAKADAAKTLRTELGAAYDERINIANRLVTEAFPKEEERMNFLEEFGNNVGFIRFASRVGARLSEHKALIGELTQKTPNEIGAKIAELRKTPGYMSISSNMSAEERQRITDEIHELSRKLHPVKPTG